MKKIISLLAVVAMIAVLCCSCAASNEIIVQTNAFFAPFEYYEGTEIVGVDVEIMNKVAEKTGKTVTFNNVEFALRITNDMPDGFSYLLFRSRQGFMENLALTIYVANDLTGELTARLSEIYPNFTIINV